MTGVLEIFAAAAVLAAPPTLDPQHLPPLPNRGLARETKAGVELETMRGRPLGLLRGLNLSHRLGLHGALLQDRTAALFTIDLYERRVRRVYPMGLPAPRGCTFTGAGARVQLFVCGHRIESLASGRRRIVARAPGRVGRWQSADLSSDEKAVLAQWSAECEIPVAFLVADGVMRPFGARTIREAPESVALGWLPNRNAVVHFPKGACGSTFRTPGIYAVPRTGKPSLLRRTPRFGSFAMWGG